MLANKKMLKEVTEALKLKWQWQKGNEKQTDKFYERSRWEITVNRRLEKSYQST